MAAITSILHVITNDQESPIDDSLSEQSGPSDQWDSMPISGLRHGDSPWTPLRLATSFSWAVNWFLIIVKLVVFILSSSKAVLAALVRRLYPDP